MTGKARSALEAVNSFLYEYLSRRSVEGIMSCLTDDVSIIGTGASERAEGGEAARELFKRNIDSAKAPFDYEVSDVRQIKQSPEISIVTCGLTAGMGEIGTMLIIRCTFVCRLEKDEGFKLSCVHFSVADPFQEDDEFFPFIFSEQELRSKLRDAERKLEATMNSVPGAIVVYEISGGAPILTYLSRGWEQLTGYSVNEYKKMYKKRAYPCVHPDDRDEALRRFNEAVSARKPVVTTHRFIRKDGSCIYISFKAAHSMDEDGVERYYGYLTDINEQMRQNAKLEAAGTRVQNILNAIPGGVVIYKLVDGEAQVQYASEGMAGLIDIPVEEFVGLSVEERRDRLAADDFTSASRELNRAVRENDMADAVFEMPKPNGEHIHIHMQGRRIGDEDGYPLVQCVFHDITKQAEAEERLYQSEQSLNIAFSTAEIFHWEYDIEKSMFTGCDGIRKRLSEYLTDDDLETWLESDAFTEQYRRRIKTLYESIMAGETSVFTEVKVRRPDGTSVWIRLRGSLVYSESGKPVKIICTSEDITAYKDLQERFEKVMQQNGIRTWEYDFKDRSIWYMGGNGNNIHDMVKLENVPESIIALGQISEESIETMRDMYARLDKGMSNVACTTKWKINDQERWIRTDYTVIFDSNGKPLRAIGSGHDVTELMNSRMRFEESFNIQEAASKDALVSYVVDVTNGKVLTYRGSKGIFTPIRTSNASDLMSGAMTIMADDAERIDFRRHFSLKNIARLHEKGQTTFTVTYRFLSIDAKPLWVELRTNIIRDPDSGDIICFVYGTDKTEQMTARAIIDAITSFDFDFIANLNIFSGDMRIFKHRDDELVFSPQGEEILYSDFVHNALDKYILTEDKEAASAAFNVANVYRQLKHAPMFEHIFRVRDVKGEVRIKKTRFANYDLRNGMVLFSRTDVTALMAEQDRQKRVLTASLKLAESANRAKTDFLSRMSHDMRTPMNAILGFSELGADSGDIDESRSYHEKVNSSGKYLLVLINDALDMSKIENDRMTIVTEAFRTREVSDRLYDLLSPRAVNKEIQLRIGVSDEVPEYVVGDRLRIEQILMNLLGNSIKYTPRGGRAELNISRESVSYGMAEIKFVISDNGMGMSEEFQQRMFTPFEQ